jgi:hypothetical protein
VLGDEDDCSRSRIVMVLIEQTVENVLVLRFMLLVPWRPGRQDKTSDT